MMTINDLLNDAILAWAAITGATTEDPRGRMTIGQYFALRETSDEARALNQSRDLDPTGVTTFMLLRSFATRFEADLVITAKEFLDDPEAAMKQLKALQALRATLAHPMAMTAVEDFKARIRVAANFYGVEGETLDGIEDILDNRPTQLAVIRRDALRSLETLEAHQFTQGAGDPTTLGYSPEIFEFWNINSLLQAAAGMRLPGIALCLIRDPINRFFNFFVIAVRNGHTVTVLTDRDKSPHPDYRSLARRPDREFLERANRHWFPYHLMTEVAVTEDEKGLYLGRSTELVATNAHAQAIGRVAGIHSSCFIWLVLLFDLVMERYGKQNHLLPETSYTAEMVTVPHALVGVNSDLVRVHGYQPLKVAPLTHLDVTTEAIRPGLSTFGAKGVNQWMVDRYAPLVPDHVLNTTSPKQALEASASLYLPGPTGEATLEAPTRRRSQFQAVVDAGVVRHTNNENRQHTPEFGYLDAVHFGTREEVLSDRLWVARRNQVEVIRQLARDEFNRTRGEVARWYRDRLEANSDRILQAVTTGEWVLPDANPAWGFETEHKPSSDRNIVGQSLSQKSGRHYSREATPGVHVHGDIPHGIYGNDEEGCVMFTGQRIARVGYHCWDDDDTLANVFTILRPTTLEALSALTGVPIEEFPWQVRTWSVGDVDTGNYLLNRLDPADTHLENPWKQFTFRVWVMLSRRSLDRRRKAMGLPKAVLALEKR